jgi:type I restriction enzyme, S subunit
MIHAHARLHKNPRRTQKTIYGKVSRQEAITIPLKSEIANSLQLLKERRAALITAAVTGQIQPEAMRA